MNRLIQKGSERVAKHACPKPDATLIRPRCQTWRVGGGAVSFGLLDFGPSLCHAEGMPIKKKTSYQKAALKRTRAATLKANAAQRKTGRENQYRPAARTARKPAKG